MGGCAGDLGTFWVLFLFSWCVSFPDLFLFWPGVFSPPLSSLICGCSGCGWAVVGVTYAVSVSNGVFVIFAWCAIGGLFCVSWGVVVLVALSWLWFVSGCFASLISCYSRLRVFREGAFAFTFSFFSLSSGWGLLLLCFLGVAGVFFWGVIDFLGTRFVGFLCVVRID